MREHKLDRFISNKPFDSWRKSRFWKDLSMEGSEFEEFKAGFPLIIYDNARSRVGKTPKRDRARNDLFHFSCGIYQPEEALIYLRFPEFIQKHFNAQVFQFQDISQSLKQNIRDVLDGNAFSSNPSFPDDPSNYLKFHYNEWHSKDMKLVRFKVPSRHTGATYTVYIIYSGRKESILEQELNENPDSFFLNRVIDYICSCQVGKRSLGSCVHVGKYNKKYHRTFE